MFVVAVALELEDAVDEMLEDARPGDGAVLRDVADEDGCDAGLFRDAQKPSRGLAHLCDRAGSGAERGCVERLDGVDDADVGSQRLERRAHDVQIRLGEDLDRLGAAEPRCAKRDLRGRLLARHEERAAPAAGYRSERTEQERRLPDPRFAADEDERGGNETAAENPIQLGYTGGDALGLVDRDIADRDRLRRTRRRRVRRRPVELLDEGAEGAAAGAASEPATGRGAAIGAGELDGDLCHGNASLGTRSDAVRHESARSRLQDRPGCIRVPLRPPQTTTKGRAAMERFNALGRGAQLMLVGAVLLFIDLFLPWQDFDVGGLADELGVDATFSGWRGIGFIVGLLTIVVLAWLIVRLASVNIPLPVSTAMTGALLGTLILVFTIIKLLTILGDEATLWAWVGVALAVLIAVGAFMTVQEAGGVETLKSEASSYGGSGSTEASVPAAPVATAPAAAAPPVVEAQPAHDHGESAADEATEAASDAIDDEPSTGRES